MPRDFTKLPPNTVTRKDRAVNDDAWIKALLNRAPVGILATVSDDQPFINMNLFVYDEQQHAIYLHTAGEGRTRFNVTGNDRVSFGVNEMGRLLPASEALEFSVEYTGVILFGRIQIVDDLDDVRRFFGMLFAKYAPHMQLGADIEPPPEADYQRPTVYRIPIEAWSGKKKEVAPDFPRAYTYGNPVFK
jgi:nitroimidazol reductase NimA-like FMN-containing flavoprotein (pyridoxamine 5'-phosphate oxidase superfamily)